MPKLLPLNSDTLFSLPPTENELNYKPSVEIKTNIKKSMVRLVNITSDGFGTIGVLSKYCDLKSEEVKKLYYEVATPHIIEKIVNTRIIDIDGNLVDPNKYLKYVDETIQYKKRKRMNYPDPDEVKAHHEELKQYLSDNNIRMINYKKQYYPDQITDVFLYTTNKQLQESIDKFNEFKSREHNNIILIKTNRCNKSIIKEYVTNEQKKEFLDLINKIKTEHKLTLNEIRNVIKYGKSHIEYLRNEEYKMRLSTYEYYKSKTEEYYNQLNKQKELITK